MNRRSFIGALPIFAAAPALADTKARGLYYVPRQAGQTMNIAVASPGNNVVFQVWEPGTTARTNADRSPALGGKPMHDAGPTDEPAAIRSRLR